MQDGLRALMRKSDISGAPLQLRLQGAVVPQHALGEEVRNTKVQSRSGDQDREYKVDHWQAEYQPYLVCC